MSTTHPTDPIRLDDARVTAYALDELYKSMADERVLVDNALDFEVMYGKGSWWCDPTHLRGNPCYWLCCRWCTRHSCWPSCGQIYPHLL